MSNTAALLDMNTTPNPSLRLVKFRNEAYILPGRLFGPTGPSRSRARKSDPSPIRSPRSIARATTSVRRIATEHDLRHLLTLTFEEPVFDYADASRATASMLRKLGRRYEPFHWLYVREILNKQRQPSRLHVHILTPRRFPADDLATCWGLGWVSQRTYSATTRHRAAEVAARYVSKEFALADAVISEAGFERANAAPLYCASKGSAPTKTVIEIADIEAGRNVIRLEDGVDPAFRQQLTGFGPPLMCARW